MAEKRREDRPKHLRELLKMDLDTAPARDLKATMIKMGIPLRGCVEKADLKKKLIESVPELRMEVERRASEASITSLGSSSTNSRPASVSSGLNFAADPLLGGGGAGSVQELQEQNRKLEGQVKELKRKMGAKESEVLDLELAMKKMTARANDAEEQALSLKAAKGGPPPLPKVWIGADQSGSDQWPGG